MDFLFDLYGTLIDIKTDEEKEELWRWVADELGAESAESVREEYSSLCTHFASASSLELFEFDLIRVFEQMLRAHGRDWRDAAAFATDFRLNSRERLELFPHVTDILSGLHERGAGVYLVSNAQTCFTLGELRECGISELFDGILISSDAGVKKPSARIFELAAERFGLELGSCVYVGNDMRDDVLGAHGAGLTTVYIPTEQSGRYPTLVLPEPDRVARDHAELKNILFDIADGVTRR